MARQPDFSVATGPVEIVGSWGLTGRIVVRFRDICTNATRALVLP